MTIEERRGGAIACLLLLVACCAACTDPPQQVKAGPLFAGVQPAPRGKALIYLYWPVEQEGHLGRVWVDPPDLSEWNGEIARGGYRSWIVEPGTTSLHASARKDLPFGAYAIMEMGDLALRVEANRVYFVRVEQTKRLLTSAISLRSVRRATATAEFSRCRRLIPLSWEEIFQTQLRSE